MVKYEIFVLYEQIRTLKQSLKLHERKQLAFSSLSGKLGFSPQRLKTHLKHLKTKGWIDYAAENISLTAAGITAAQRLVRAHRLWETYLVQQMGLTEEQIHEDAEKYEHLLTDELLDEVNTTLGFPTKDPHGSPIPGNE